MMRKLFLIFSIIILASCATQKYRFGDIIYDTPEAALKVAQEQCDRNVSVITPTENPLGARALCVLPSRNLIEKKGIRITGTPKPEGINYVVSISEIDQDGMAQALRKRQIFSDVKIVKSNDPETFTMPEYEIIIYRVIKSPDQIQWFLKTSPNKEALPIHMDMSLPVGAPRILSWLKHVENLAREQLGK
jgi:hypothetical protein